jgi:tRNA-specific 2-thiouridylase
MRGGGGVVIELIDGEDGVAPGQACVLYDAPDGQARVLGGGFIKSTLAMTTAANTAIPEPARASSAS